MNQFGSAQDKIAKACANTIRLYVLVDGEVLPCLIKAPPSSLSKKESLMRWLTTAANIAAKAGMGTKYQPIQVKFSLRKKQFDSGMNASVIEIQTLRVLDKDKDAAKLNQLPDWWCLISTRKTAAMNRSNSLTSRQRLK